MITRDLPDPAAWSVFTPTRPARLAFVERPAINTKLVDALRTPGKQLVVYGHTGSGKTTLLVNKLHQLYEAHVISRCVRASTFAALILDAFDQLNPFYDASTDVKTQSQVSKSFAALYSSLKFEIGKTRSREHTTTSHRLLPPQLTIQNLGKLLGAARCCWVLEDFHKLPNAERLEMSQALKVFMDMADDYPELKIIAIGAVNTAREVINWEPEMNTRLAEVQVPLMEDRELLAIIMKGEELLNFRLPAAARGGIVRYSNGLAAVCHQLCLNICLAAGIESPLRITREVTGQFLDDALQRYVQDLSDTLKEAFDRAFRQERKGKYLNGRLIVSALARCEQEGAPFGMILEKIRERAPDYPASNLTRHLRELQEEYRGGLLSYDPASGSYRFADPIYRVFAISREQTAEHQKVDAEILFDLGLLDTREVAAQIARFLRE